MFKVANKYFIDSIATTFLQVKPEYVTTSIDRDTKLKYLIPTAEGPGASTAAFIRFLVSVHNTFVTRCNISSNTDTGTRGTAPRYSRVMKYIHNIIMYMADIHSCVYI